MSSKIYVPTSGPADWKRLLAQPDRHWRDGFSGKSAAERWEASDGLPTEIANQFLSAGLGPAELLLAIPEWKTPLPGSSLGASQTDILALVRTPSGVFACGVEAKVAESFDKTIDEWLQDASPGKKARLAYLKQLLGLPEATSGLIRYQLLHRTAAALIEAERFGCAGAAMIVHSFSARKEWLEDFQAFSAALGATVSPDAPSLATVPGGRPLLLGWAMGPSAEI
jgi:hypothetical protein